MTVESFLKSCFSLDGRVAVVTGGSGVLGGAMARALASAGARVALLGRDAARLDSASASLHASGHEALGIQADVLVEADLTRARAHVAEHWGRVDILVNAAGGNVPGAVLPPGDSPSSIDTRAVEAVIDLNLTGTWRACQVFMPAMTGESGSVVNVSSMATERALTMVGPYGAAKAGVEALTRWLAVEWAQRHGDRIRVNAIAPGFFLGEQNRSLLVNPDETPTARGAAVLHGTPAGRFGEPDDLAGTIVWLCSPAARFVTGAVIPVDGGFKAFGGV
jgi:NAD(P)-dependent dehydrogenase (short-subunit alcohol dehydrogenase family)